MENLIQYTPILLAIVGLIVMYVQSVWVRKQSAGTRENAVDIQKYQRRCSGIFKCRISFVVGFCSNSIMRTLLISSMVETTSWLIVPAFVVGAIFSALAGNIGMRIATEANARTAEAAKPVCQKHSRCPLGVVLSWALASLDLLYLD